MATDLTYAPTAISISELCGNINTIIEGAGNSAIAIINDNRPTAYLVPAEAFEALIDKLEDLELAATARQRRGGKTIRVSLDEL